MKATLRSEDACISTFSSRKREEKEMAVAKHKMICEELHHFSDGLVAPTRAAASANEVGN